VPQPLPGKETAKIRFPIRRESDQVGDEVEIALPIRPDRPPVREQRLVEVAPGATVDLSAPPGDVRPSSYAGALAVAVDSSGRRNTILCWPIGRHR
jgi:alpha-2-macroglobulin